MTLGAEGELVDITNWRRPPAVSRRVLSKADRLRCGGAFATSADVCACDFHGTGPSVARGRAPAAVAAARQSARGTRARLNSGGDWGRDELLFRDYLAANSAARDQYAALKRDLMARWHDDRQAYGEAKTAFVLDTLERARTGRPSAAGNRSRATPARRARRRPSRVGLAAFRLRVGYGPETVGDASDSGAPASPAPLPGISSAISGIGAPDRSTLPTHRQSTLPRQHRSPAFRESGRKGAMIAKDFIIAKDFCTYTTIILRQDKSLRDHAPTRRIRWALCGVRAARCEDLTGQLAVVASATASAAGRGRWVSRPAEVPSSRG